MSLRKNQNESNIIFKYFEISNQIYVKKADFQTLILTDFTEIMYFIQASTLKPQRRVL